MSSAINVVVSRRPRLLYIANVAGFFVSHRLEHAAAARSAGYDVHVATRVVSDADGIAIRESALALHDIPIGRGDTGLVYDMRSLIIMLRLINRLRPDIVHLVGIKPVLLGGFASRVLGVPALVVAIAGLGTVFSSTGFKAQVRRFLVSALMRISLRKSRVRLIFQNRGDLESLVQLNVVARKYARLIRGSGVHLGKYVVAPEPDQPLRIVLAARMLRTKGVTVFEGAARVLRKQFPTAQFLLAGDIDAANPDSLTRDELCSMEASGNIEWLGHVEDMPRLFQTCHIICLPTYYGEGVPKVLIEGAAAGRPIVTTTISGCDDICIDGVNGLLVLPRSIEALAEALSRLIQDPGLRTKFGAAGRRRVEKFFSLDLVAQQILAVYDEFDIQCSRHA